MAFTTFPIATKTGSSNPFPKVNKVEQAAGSVGTPSAGSQNEFIDSTTHHANRKDASGNVVDLESMQAVLTAAPGTPINGTLWFQDDTVNKIVSVYYRTGGVTKGPFPLFNYT